MATPSEYFDIINSQLEREKRHIQRIAKLDDAQEILTRSRDSWEADAVILAKNARHHEKRTETVEAENARLREALHELFGATKNEMVNKGLPLEWQKDCAMGRAEAALAREGE